MSEEIASTNLICITPAGDRIPVTISIGRPVKDDAGFWACPVSLHGLYPRLRPMKSDESFHALCLSIHLVRDLLYEFVGEGGQIMIAGTEEEQELPLGAYFPLPSRSIGGPDNMSNDLDDGERPQWGVGVFARKTENGVRLTLDTLKRIGEGKPTWESWIFITHRTLERAKFLDHDFSEEEFAAFGRTVMGALAAQFERHEEE